MMSKDAEIEWSDRDDLTWAQELASDTCGEPATVFRRPSGLPLDMCAVQDEGDGS